MNKVNFEQIEEDGLTDFEVKIADACLIFFENLLCKKLLTICTEIGDEVIYSNIERIAFNGVEKNGKTEKRLSIYLKNKEKKEDD